MAMVLVAVALCDAWFTADVAASQQEPHAGHGASGKAAMNHKDESIWWSKIDEETVLMRKKMKTVQETLSAIVGGHGYDGYDAQASTSPISSSFAQVSGAGDDVDDCPTKLKKISKDDCPDKDADLPKCDKAGLKKDDLCEGKGKCDTDENLDNCGKRDIYKVKEPLDGGKGISDDDTMTMIVAIAMVVAAMIVAMLIMCIGVRSRATGSASPTESTPLTTATYQPKGGREKAPEEEQAAPVCAFQEVANSDSISLGDGEKGKYGESRKKNRSGGEGGGDDTQAYRSQYKTGKGGEGTLPAVAETEDAKKPE
jgi:hypothetical protein